MCVLCALLGIAAELKKHKASSLSLFLFLSCSFNNKETEGERWEQDNVDSFRWKSGKKVIQQTDCTAHRGDTRCCPSDGCVNWHEALCAGWRSSRYQSRDFYVDCQLRIARVSGWELSLFASNLPGRYLTIWRYLCQLNRPVWTCLCMSLTLKYYHLVKFTTKAKVFPSFFLFLDWIHRFFVVSRCQPLSLRSLSCLLSSLIPFLPSLSLLTHSFWPAVQTAEMPRGVQR